MTAAPATGATQRKDKTVEASLFESFLHEPQAPPAPAHAARAGAGARRVLAAAALLLWFAALPLAWPAGAWAADAKPAAASAGAKAKSPEPEPEPLEPCPTSMGSLSTGLAPVPPATANFIRERLRKHVGEAVSICRTPFGWYEVIIEGEFFYVDERANFLLAGNAYDLRADENLTEARRVDALRIDFNQLPLQLAVKTVRGDGSRTLAVFEDPNCPYCKRFEKEIAGLTNTTIYTFLYPILSRNEKAPDDSYPKSKAIWCAPDRSRAWAQLMLEGKRLDAAPDSCQHPLEDILALGHKLHISGTPTIVFTDGRRAPGVIPMEKVEKMMAEAAHAGKTSD
jgi:thiol:disulfide interchange protein DsbC